MKKKYLLALPLSLLLVVAACSNKNTVKGKTGNVSAVETTVAVPKFNADSAYRYVEAQTMFGPRVPGTDGHTLTVTNNMNPKLSEKGSTGIGLANIRQRYKDLIGRDITVSDSGGFYRVTIPLVAPPSRSWNGTTVPDTDNLIIIPQK